VCERESRVRTLFLFCSFSTNHVLRQAGAAFIKRLDIPKKVNGQEFRLRGSCCSRAAVEGVMFGRIGREGGKLNERFQTRCRSPADI
jgi:hypothetical protein